MRKVLILMALLPGLALADPVGGPSANSGIQTSSPQNNTANLNYLQPAPNASAANLAAPANNPANALQGSVPSSADQLTVEADGAPQSLPSGGTSNNLAIIILALAAVALLAVAAVVWQLSNVPAAAPYQDEPKEELESKPEAETEPEPEAAE